MQMMEATAAVIWQGDKFLICQRPRDKYCGLLWEFPSGKIEPAETAKECIARECREELGVTQAETAGYEFCSADAKMLRENVLRKLK